MKRFYPNLLLDLLDMQDARQRILLVDDSEEDRFLILQALTDAGLNYDVRQATDGEEAETYLFGSMNDGDLPHMVILDLRLPKRSGREVMEKLYATGLAKRTRVVVLSSIMPSSEVKRLHDLGAWAVFEKPIDLDAFAALGKFVKELSTADPLPG